MANQDLAEKRSSGLSTLFAPMRDYLRGTAGELRKVHWPTRAEARRLTLVVLAVMFAMAVFLGLFDFLFERLMLEILQLNLIAIAIGVVIILSILVLVFFASRERRY
ncbi:MAG: preprotein translocase subunit SecE [Anaerolineae bacterium]|nr:preprotein translocase subunit SecE [Thermoflexales bacterium]MDW8395735.1 preprotein translocase subunit SecE [Anaerolineae bacterium]